MNPALLIVLSRPVPKRDDDFNDWYSNIHFHDVLRFRGSIASQRFKLSARRPQGYNDPLNWNYLALYEVDDPARFTQEHIEAINSVRMEITDAFDSSVLNDFYYYEVAARNAGPISGEAQGVVLEQIMTQPGQEQAFRDWYESSYLPVAARRPGVQSATLLQYHPDGQMLPSHPEANFVAVYRLSDPAAMASWDADNALFAGAPVKVSGTTVSNWDILTARLTKDAMRHPTSRLLAEEAQARARMGGNVAFASRDVLK